MRVIWIAVSLFGSWYFAYRLWPRICESNSNVVVSVNFRANPLPGADFKGVTFWHNIPSMRDRYRGNYVDKDIFWYTACALLPLSQKQYCDWENNWNRITLKELGCKDMMSCEAERYTVPEQTRNDLFIKPKKDAAFTLAERPGPSLADPGGWGDNGKLPLFFVCWFLATKLGKALDEFLFQPYRKQASN